MDIYTETIGEIRKFNRFYTVNMGFLDADYLESRYSVAETRILFEIKSRSICIQNDIVNALRIDKSYLSRIIQRFCNNGLIEKIKSGDDKRSAVLKLTALGNEEAERLVKLTDGRIGAKIACLTEKECDALRSALNIAATILGKGETL